MLKLGLKMRMPAHFSQNPAAVAAAQAGAARLAGPSAAIAKAADSATIPVLASGTPTAVWKRSATFAALYLVAMIACIALGRLGAQVTPIWIPSAVLAWALFRSEPRDWPIYLSVTALAHAAGAFAVGDQFNVEAVYLVANLASPLVVAALMRQRGYALAFEERAEVFGFLLIGAVVAPAVSAGIVALGALAEGTFSARFAVIWFLSDGLSFIVFLPLFKIVSSNGWRELLAPALGRKVAILFAVLIAAHALASFLPAGGYRVFMTFIIPYLIYVAFDVGLTAARAALAISAVLLLAYALLAPAPADRNLGPQEYLLAVQAFVAAMVASVLPVAVVLQERQRLYETASASLHDAQEAWGELIAAEAHFRMLAEHVSDLILRVRRDGEILFSSPASRTLREDGLDGLNLLALAPDEDIPFVRSEIDALVTTGDFEKPRIWRVRLQDMKGDLVPFEMRATLVTEDEFVAVLHGAPQ
jgi:integral membrane sensor domain MASE1